MRFPGLKSRKSSSGAPSSTAASPPASTATTPGSDDTLVNGAEKSSSSSSSGILSLSRWKSNVSSVDEHGVLLNTAPPPASASTTTTANTGKRSFFGRRKSHSRSLSSDAQSTLNDAADTQNRQHATITSSSAAGGHPLRQHTLPADLDGSTPPKSSKRPGLSFHRRGFTTADLSSSSNDHDPPRKSSGSASYHTISSTSHALDSPDARPLLRTPDPPSSRSSDSFQLRSFRSVTGVREEPTLSSLVKEELTHSPLSTRPSSPATAPLSSTGTTSYFDSRPSSPASSTRTTTTPGASISVSRFREAKAARSNSSLNSNASQGTAHAKPSGLKLDLPPPINLEYASPRPSLNITQSDQYAQDDSRPKSPLSGIAAEPLSRASSSSPSKESFTTALATAVASPPRLASPILMQRSTSPSLYSHEERLSSPVSHPLAAHPDNALPLPPVPHDPQQQQRQHRRTQSNQSISSLSASLGSWLNTTSAGFGITFSADDVQKAFAERAAALRSRTPSIKDGIMFGSTSPDRSMSQQQSNNSYLMPEEEIIASPASLGPSKEELAILLGGKVLPPPPSETGDDFFPAALAKQPSPKAPLSRASSFSNLAFGTNLFTSAFSKVAKPARDDDDEESDVSRDTSLPRIMPPSKPTPKKASRASNAFHASNTSSDEDGNNVDDDEEEDESDDSAEKAKKREKSLVFPPPRPTNEADRQRLYKAAMTPPSLTPQGSSSDLKAYMQPVPRSAPLTSANVEALNNDEDDDEENIPLSTLKIRAQSEIGLSSPRSFTNAAIRSSQAPYGGSALGTASANPASQIYDRRQQLVQSTSQQQLDVPAASAGMPRSLSAFNTTVSEAGAASRHVQPRSASSQAIATLASPSTQHNSPGTPLFDSDKPKIGAGLSGPEKKSSMDPPKPKPRETSTTTSPSTATGTSKTSTSSPARRSSKLFGGNITHLSPIGSHQKASPTSTPGAPEGSGTTSHARANGSGHTKTKSVPLISGAANESMSSNIKERHRAEARKSGTLLGNAISVTPQPGNNTVAMPHGWPLSPQALQAMPPPPGVDPNLYASLPADQKLNLQMRAQQLMSVMQSMAMQAQNGTLAASTAISSNMITGYPYGQLPVQMQMPMMGSTVSAFPPFPNFFGMPAAFPGMMPQFFNNNTNAMQQYPVRAAPSAIGQPTLLQQAGLSINESVPSSNTNSQHNRRRSQ